MSTAEGAYGSPLSSEHTVDISDINEDVSAAEDLELLGQLPVFHHWWKTFPFGPTPSREQLEVYLDQCISNVCILIRILCLTTNTGGSRKLQSHIHSHTWNLLASAWSLASAFPPASSNLLISLIVRIHLRTLLYPLRSRTYDRLATPPSNMRPCRTCMQLPGHTCLMSQLAGSL